MRRYLLSGTLASLLLVAGGCASDNGTQSTEKGGPGVDVSQNAKVTTTTEDGILVKRFDLDGDANPDVIKYFEILEDPDRPDVKKHRMQRKKVDVNADGEMDIVREYNEDGDIRRERADLDLDGTFDTVSHFDGGQLARKETLTDDGEGVAETRFYSDGNLVRVERDRNEDGKVDYWEYYEDGLLQRIGRDMNGDEKIDRWVHREKK